MDKLSKIQWSEGLFIKPQHFQQQDMYHENRSAYLNQTLHPYCWGIKHVSIDTDALQNNTIRILELEMIFPDGTIIKTPLNDPLPPDFKLSPEDAQASSLMVAINLPNLQSIVSNTHESSHKQTVRFNQTHKVVADLYDNDNQCELEFVVCQTYLSVYDDDKKVDLNKQKSVTTIPLIRLYKTSSTGTFSIDRNFIPTIINWGASTRISDILKTLLDILQAKANALHGYHSEPVKNIIEFRSNDVASFWLLHTTNHYYMRLAHLKSNPGFSAERLYHEMLGLAGALMTFSSLYNPQDLKPYDHLAPAECFLHLDRCIRELLGTVISTRMLSIALQEYKPSFWTGSLISEKITEETEFYLGIKCNLTIPELCENVQSRFKIGAPDDVEKMVLSAMPGVSLSYTPQTPAAVSVKPGFAYFELEKKGLLYERMLQSKNLNLYIPKGIEDLHFELIAVV